MAWDFVYLTAAVDWFIRRVLTWQLSVTRDTAFCIETAEEALAKHGKPKIFNSDQGSQFTSVAFTDLLKKHEIAISMDGKGAWRDNVFVETALPDDQIREGLSSGVRQCAGGEPIHRQLLQRLPTPFEP